SPRNLARAESSCRRDWEWFNHAMSESNLFAPFSADVYEVRTKARGPAGQLPINAEILLNQPSGNLFGLTQDAGMGWKPEELGRKQFLILSTQGGLRAP